MFGYFSNVAAIVVENETPASLISIAAVEGQTQYCAFSVPKEHTCLVRGIIVAIESLKTVTIQLLAREQFDVVTAPMQPVRVKRNYASVAQGIWPIHFCRPIKLPEKTDVYVTGVTGTGTSAASVNMDLLLIPNR